MKSNPSPEDEARLRASLEMLKQNSRLEYFGEYGAEITTFIPFVAWLKREGHLKGRRILTYAGMRVYYFFLDDDEFEEKEGVRHWLPISDRYWPSNSTYTATASPWHVYHDYRQQFRHSDLTFKKPVLFIQNKFTVEWRVGPINFIPLFGLKRLLTLTEGKFDVVYSRPGSHQSGPGYSRDRNQFCDYPDMAIIEKFDHVLHLEALCADSGRDYNLTKLQLLARSHLYVATQGGGAHILACFGDSLLLIMDRSEDLNPDGSEYPHAYAKGPYKYLAKHPPKLLVATNFADFNTAVHAVGRATMSASGATFPASADDIFAKLTL